MRSLVKALDSEKWDPSVKSLVPFPKVIATMNTIWSGPSSSATRSRRQRLRRQAQKAGSLKTTEQQRVAMQEDEVVIQPANPETVYVFTLFQAWRAAVSDQPTTEVLKPAA